MPIHGRHSRATLTVDTGEGGCDLYFKKSQPIKKSTEPLSFDCVWVPGFTDHEIKIFKVKLPGFGDQHWQHLVMMNGTPLGWYLTAISALSPMAAPIPVKLESNHQKTSRRS